MTAPTTSKRGPQIITRWLLVLFLVGICSRGYGYYNQDFKASPQVWMDVVHGTASAPEQYRIGVVMPAYWLSQHMHLRLSQVFGLFDVVSSILAALLLYSLLTGTKAYERASTVVQWFGSSAFLALTLYLVDWVNWYQKATTLPTTLLVAAMLWLWTPKLATSLSKPQQALTTIAFLFLVVAQSFIRADVAVMVCIGVFVASATRLSPNLALSRGMAMACSLIGAFAAITVQVYLMKVLYPHASYGGVPVWMLLHDWTRLTNWVSALIFMSPFLWTLTQAVRRRFSGEGAGGAFLIAASGYAGIWLVMGRLDEVRIFLPMALAITPLTVEMAMLMLEERHDTECESDQ